MVFTKLLKEARDLNVKLNKAARYATVPNIWLAQEGADKLLRELEIVARARGEAKDGSK